MEIKYFFFDIAEKKIISMTKKRYKLILEMSNIGILIHWVSPDKPRLKGTVILQIYRVNESYFNLCAQLLLRPIKMCAQNFYSLLPWSLQSGFAITLHPVHYIVWWQLWSFIASRLKFNRFWHPNETRQKIFLYLVERLTSETSKLSNFY